MFDLINIPYFFILVDEINAGNYFYIIPISIFLSLVIINELRKAVKRNKEQKDDE